MKELIFEKVGDINTKYPYIYVYSDGMANDPFMEISISDTGRIEFSIFKRNDVIVLSDIQWKSILDKAEVFLLKVMADEEASSV